MAEQAAGDVQDQGREHAQTLVQKLKYHRPAGPLGWAVLLGVGGIVSVGSVIGLILLTPVFIFFSPILVPLGLIFFLCTAGLVAAAGTALAAGSAIVWLYKYFKGRHPPGSDQIDHAMSRLHDTAEHVKHKALDLGGQTQASVQEAAAPGA